MSEGLKFLMITTCVVVIAAAGYFVWADRSDRAALADAAKASVERSALRDTCRTRIETIDRGNLSGDDILVLQDCVSNGVKSGDEMKRSIAKRNERLGG